MIGCFEKGLTPSETSSVKRNGNELYLCVRIALCSVAPIISQYIYIYICQTPVDLFFPTCSSIDRHPTVKTKQKTYANSFVTIIATCHGRQSYLESAFSVVTELRRFANREEQVADVHRLLITKQAVLRFPGVCPPPPPPSAPGWL